MRKSLALLERKHKYYLAGTKISPAQFNFVNSRIQNRKRNFKKRASQFILEHEATAQSSIHSIRLLIDTLQKNEKVLFVNTDPAISPIVEECVEYLKQNYINEQWIPGLLTNRKSYRRMLNLAYGGAWGKSRHKFKNNQKDDLSFNVNPTKTLKTEISFSIFVCFLIANIIKRATRQVNSRPTEGSKIHISSDQLQSVRQFKGLRHMQEKTNQALSLVVIFNAHDNIAAFQEATRMGIPTIAFTDAKQDLTKHHSQSFYPVIINTSPSFVYDYFQVLFSNYVS